MTKGNEAAAGRGTLLAGDDEQIDTVLLLLGGWTHEGVHNQHQRHETTLCSLLLPTETVRVAAQAERQVDCPRCRKLRAARTVAQKAADAAARRERPKVREGSIEPGSGPATAGSRADRPFLGHSMQEADERNREPKAARCSGRNDGEPCEAAGTRWLYPPDGKRPVVGLWCERHAKSAIEEYHQALGEEWRAVPLEERGGGSIVDDLGGMAFKVASDAHFLIDSGNELQGHIRGARGRIDGFVVRRTGAGYRLAFYRIPRSGPKLRTIAERNGVSAEKLQTTFSEITGIRIDG